LLTAGIQEALAIQEILASRLRTIYGFAISAKRYALFRYVRGSLIIEDAKGHGLGYLMPPKIRKQEEDDWIKEAWGYVLQLEGIKCCGAQPEWLNRPAMMRIPVSPPAVLGRILKGPTLVTRFHENSDEWDERTIF